MTKIIFSDTGTCELSQVADVTYEIRLHNAVSLVSLLQGELKKRILVQQFQYINRPWASAQVPAGAYRLRLPIPFSNSRTTGEQSSLLFSGEKPIPIALALLTLLRCEPGSGNPLRYDWKLRCAEGGEGADTGYRATLSWDGASLEISMSFIGKRCKKLWIGGSCPIYPAA